MTECPQCHSPSVKTLFLGLNADDTSRDPIPIMRCDACGVTFSNLSAALASTSELYFDGYYGETVAHRPVNRSMVNVFQRERERLALKGLAGGAILDVGCGDGTFLRNLPGAWRTFGYEPSDAGQQALRRNGITPVDIYDEHLDGNAFDVVTLWHSFEHVSEPPRLLAAVRRLLKKDGRLFVSVPNFASWQAQLFGKRWFHLDPARHCFHYTPRTLCRLLEANGFTVRRRTTLSWEYGIAGWWQSLFNLTPLEFNMGYKVLKARKRYPRNAATALSLGTYAVLGAPVAAVATAMMLLEAANKRGGAIHVVAALRQA